MSTVNINLQAKDLTASGGQGVVDPTPNTLVQRTSTGAIKATDATTDNEVVNKQQMEEGLAGKLDKTTSKQVVYARNSVGEDTTLFYSYAATASVAVRGDKGVLQVGTPTADNHATTKKYVDDAIKTAPGGWKTILDKTWTEDETTNYSITIDIPTEYQKAMSELRMTYYNDTPQAGAVYSNQTVNIRLHDGEKAITFLYTGNIMPTKDTTEATVAFDTTGVDQTFLYGNGHYDTSVASYNMIRFKDSSGNYVEPVPTDPNVILNNSKITNATQGGTETGVDWTIDSYLPNRSHTYTYNEAISPITATYKSNDYYNSAHADYIVSQVIETSDPENLPIGSFVNPQRSNLIWVSAININFTSAVPISYKSVVTRLASIVGESMQVIAGAESKQNAMTSFNDVSINGNPLPGGYAYYGHLKNGYPTKVILYPQPSTSNGVTANKIYAGSRLIVQVKY